MSSSNDLTCRLAFLGDGADELNFLEAISAQFAAPVSGVYSSTKQRKEYQRFACDYCVLYPAATSAEVIKSLVSAASECPSHPKIILLLPKQNTRRLKEGFEELGTQPQIIRLEKPDKLRAVELINSFLILERQVRPPCPGWEFVGASAPVRVLYNSISSFARWDKDPVLISGETGTGKELVARLLHKIRNIGDFRAYNFAAIPLLLSDSLLFGHKKGAFTDAKEDHVGYIVNADDGTLFIDEIGDVELAVQVKLLRTLQERKVLKLGEAESHAKDIKARFVFATNRDLKEACRKGKFREDLFHRISALQIDVPPLRQRKADIPLLVEYFVNEFVGDYDGKTTEIGLDNILELDALFEYEWTGNVRELRNVVRQAAAMTGTGYIDKKLAGLVEEKIMESEGGGLQLSLPQTTQRSRELTSFMGSLLDDTRPNAKRRFEKAYDQALFLKTRGDYRRMMDHADIKKTAAFDIINKLDIPYFKTGELIAAASLAAKLKQQADPVSAYIRGRFDPRTVQMLNDYGGGEPQATLLGALVKELNRLLQDPDLYQAERFHQVALSEDTQDLIKQQGAWTDLFRLNRMLIEDAYPHEIMRSEAIRSGGNGDHQTDSAEEDLD